jgi:hypothetical protein
VLVVPPLAAFHRKVARPFDLRRKCVNQVRVPSTTAVSESTLFPRATESPTMIDLVAASALVLTSSDATMQSTADNRNIADKPTRSVDESRTGRRG